MSSSPADEERSPAAREPRTLRASDADRESVANVLREAAGDGRLTMDELDERLDAVYAAKTYAELEPITHDLPDAGTVHAPAVPPAPAGDPARFGGEPTSNAAVAILGGFSRKGEWVVPKDFTAFCFMGGAEVIVPEDATVRVTGIGIMGAFEHSGAGTGSPDGPVITINGVAFMGGVDVKRKPTIEASREARQQRLEDRRQRLEARQHYHQERHQHHLERRDRRRTGELD